MTVDGVGRSFGEHVVLHRRMGVRPDGRTDIKVYKLDETVLAAFTERLKVVSILVYFSP